MKNVQTKKKFIENNNSNSFIINNITFPHITKNLSQNNIYQRCLSDLEDIKNETNTNKIITKIIHSNKLISSFLSNKKQIQETKKTNEFPNITKYIYHKKIIPSFSVSILKVTKKNSNNLLNSKNVTTTEYSNKTSETTLYNILQEKIQNIKDSKPFHNHNFSFCYNSNLNNSSTSIDTNITNNLNTNNINETFRYMSKRDFFFDSKKKLCNLKKAKGRNSCISSYNNSKKCFDKTKKEENKQKNNNNYLNKHFTFKKIPLCRPINKKNNKKFSFNKRTKTNHSINNSDSFSNSTRMSDYKNLKINIKRSIPNKNNKNNKKEKKPLCIEINLDKINYNEIKDSNKNNEKEKLIKKTGKNVNIKIFKNDFIIIPKISDENFSSNISAKFE